jgi:hypothetical protein
MPLQKLLIHQKNCILQQPQVNTGTRHQPCPGASDPRHRCCHTLATLAIGCLLMPHFPQCSNPSAANSLRLCRCLCARATTIAGATASSGPPGSACKYTNTPPWNSSHVFGSTHSNTAMEPDTTIPLNQHCSLLQPSAPSRPATMYKRILAADAKPTRFPCTAYIPAATQQRD